MHVTASTAEVSARRTGNGSPRRRSALRVLAAGAALLTITLVPAAVASAQAVPTIPCPGCGPGTPGDGSRPWSYTEFVCEPQRGFILQFGVGGNVGEPVNFSVGIAPAGSGPVAVQRVASNVPPGARRDSLLPAPTATGLVDVRIVGVGANSGRVLLDNTRELECNCTQQPTTVPATTVPVTTVPEQVTTTVPGQTTTTVPGQTTTTQPGVATSVGRSSTVPGTLPETGRSSSSVAVGGVMLVAAGMGALLIVAFVRRRPVAES